MRDLDESDLKAATGGATLDTTLSSTSLTYWSGGGGWWSGGGSSWSG